MNLFYVPEFQEDIPCLNEEESYHALKVLRMKEGDLLFITDGKGNLYEAKITEPKSPFCVVKVLKTYRSFQDRNYNLHIAIAPTKNIERMEWFVEKATEIGIDTITFLECHHSERRQMKIDRMEKIAVSAMKQSLKPYLPKLNNLVDFDKFVCSTHLEQTKWLAHLDKENPKLFHSLLPKNTSSLVLIGPEGDFSEEEIALATANQFQIVSLGANRLRTETAGLMACSIAKIINELAN